MITERRSNLVEVYHELSMSQSSGLSSQCDVQVIITETGENDTDKLEYQKPAYVAVALIMAMTIMSVFFPMVITSFGIGRAATPHLPPPPCPDPCRAMLVESIPDNLTFPAGSPRHMSTYDGWRHLLQLANHSIDLVVFYWTLRGVDVYSDPSDWQGEEIFKELLSAGRDRGIKIRIAQNLPRPDTADLDAQELVEKAHAEVRSLNFSAWFGGGVLHTKLWVVDQQHFYVGSANMDWRSLTQVKELGVVVTQCPCLATDMQKLFEVYWYMGAPHKPVPPYWPPAWATRYNAYSPMSVHFNGSAAGVYLSSSPAAFCPRGRSSDIAAILSVIRAANKFIHIAVMDYFPTTLYSKPRRFWPVIDDALRAASFERGVEVRVMASWWNHTRPDMPRYLTSLAALNHAGKANIQVKLFHVPAFTPAQERIPFGRVNHNKYMVTDNTAYIGTSNWSGDYFISTGGVGFVLNVETTNATFQTSGSQHSLPQQLESVFERDWNSRYALPVEDALKLHKTLQETSTYNEPS